VKALVAAGASLDFSQCEYGSPLQAAVSRNRESVSQYLLDIGADINARGGRLGTALQAASWVGDHKMVSTLLAAGAHTTSGGSCFGGPLGAAMSRQHKAIQHLSLSLKPWRAKTRLSRQSAFDSLFPIHHLCVHVLFWVQSMGIEGSEMS
jgi:ankyrin repeat protein